MTEGKGPDKAHSEQRQSLPARLGKYRVIEEIGRGGMAVVYRCEDTQTGATVAAKALLPELSAQTAFVKRFRREIETHRGLDHPCIVKILDVGQEGHIQYYVMEFMDGPTVEKQLRLLGKFPVAESIRVTRALLDALHYAHGRGVVHRDIKPANIMTGSDGAVKLADFGIAKDVDATRLTVTGGIVGTADYMSPEQAEGRRVTKRSDIYSVGVCLYQMLTGRLPFIGKTYLDVIRAHRFSIPESPRTLNPSIPGRIARLVESMMAKDPDKRPVSAAEVITKLDQVESERFELTDEERDSARDMIKWALLSEVGWKETTLRITAGVAAIVILIFVVYGFRYRYFTSPLDKYNRGMASLARGDYDKAEGYFEDVTYSHPTSPEAARASQRIRVIRYIKHKMEETAAAPASKTDPDARDLYEQADEMMAKGDREQGTLLLRLLARDLGDTVGGKLAAAKLKELRGDVPRTPERRGAKKTPGIESTGAVSAPAVESSGQAAAAGVESTASSAAPAGQ